MNTIQNGSPQDCRFSFMLGVFPLFKRGGLWYTICQKTPERREQRHVQPRLFGDHQRVQFSL